MISNYISDTWTKSVEVESLADAKLTFEGLVSCGVEHTFKSAPERAGSVDVWCI
jgi:hypothetical protein